MNYTWQYQPSSGPGGDAAYWAAFPFQFTNNEVLHLRHGFYNNVVMGANAFGTGAADVDADQFAAPAEDRSGLALEVRSKRSFAYGEPVVVELKLSATDTPRHGDARLSAPERRLHDDRDPAAVGPHRALPAAAPALRGREP
jgi:hypothetical protein